MFLLLIIHQNGDLKQHLKKAFRDLEKTIPSDDFDGLGIIDWEAWRPTWEFNWERFRIYQTKSFEKVKERHTNLNAAMIEEIAQQQWEQSAKYIKSYF